jgi:DNA-binding MarR family transcriptional regulator
VRENDLLRLEVLGRFREIFLAVRTHYDTVSQTLGVTGTELWALWELQQRPRQRVTDLAERLYVRQSTVSNLVERLVNGGLLARVRKDADRRVVRLQLTAKGSRLLAQAPEPAPGVLHNALAQLGARDLQRLKSGLDALVLQMEKRIRGGTKVPLAQI